VGVVPFSNVGYDFTATENTPNSTLASVMTYSGTGGFSQAYLGVGYEVLKGFSIGANFSYFWGNYTKTLGVAAVGESHINVMLKGYETNVSSYKLDFGAQGQFALDRNNKLTVGATFGIGHKLGADANMFVMNTDSETAQVDTTTVTLGNAFQLPMTFGVGAALVHKRSLTVGADYTYEHWGNLDFPQSNELSKRYEMSSSVLRDRHKITIGADWIPEPNQMVRRSFFKSIHYKVGASYATPYYNIRGGEKGPREFVLSGGFAIPIINSWNNRSLLNISAQWVNSSASNYIRENSFRINIGLTFNERWFAKWKVD
jgi:hypothetical protein